MGFAFVSLPKILVKNACQSFAEKRSAHILLKTAQHLLDLVALILSVKEMTGKNLHTFEFCRVLCLSYGLFYIVIDKKPFQRSQVQFLL